MSRNFNQWLNSFKDSIADYGYYIDFKKVHQNVDAIKVQLPEKIIPLMSKPQSHVSFQIVQIILQAEHEISFRTGMQ